MKNGILALIGALGSGIISLFGGWSSGIITLFIFIAIDYASGLIVSGVFHKSTKTETGELESNAHFKGVCKKFMILVLVVISYRIDLLLSTDYITNAVIIAFCLNELLSITENAGLMGVPIPSAITNAIYVLKKKGENND